MTHNSSLDPLNPCTLELSSRKPLPPGWRWVCLGDICEISTGGTPSTSHPEYYGGEICWLKSGDIVGPYINSVPGRITLFGLKNSNARLHPVGSVMLAMSGQGKTRATSGILKVPSACSQSVAAILPTEHATPEFIHLWLLNRYDHIRSITGDNERSGLNLGLVEKIEIPLPPLEEQKRVAAMLNEQMAEIEKAHAAARAQLDAAKALPAAFLRAVFHSPEARSWTRKPLGEVCEFTYGEGLPSSGRENGTIPVFGSNGIVGYHNKALTSGPTIIIGRKGSIGKVHYCDAACWPIDTTYYIERTKEQAGLVWLAFWLKSQNLGGLNKAAAVPGLNRDDAYALQISFPPLEEQKRLAAELDEELHAAENTIASLQSRLAEIERLPSGFLRQAFSGEL